MNEIERKRERERRTARAPELDAHDTPNGHVQFRSPQ